MLQYTLTNNNAHKGNEMFEKLTSDDLITDTDDYNAAVEMAEAQLELEMIEADRYAEIDEYIDEMYDEIEMYDEDDEADEDVEFEGNFDSFEETVHQLDDSRDLDFYES
jgi:hypothetical protein